MGQTSSGGQRPSLQRTGRGQKGTRHGAAEAAVVGTQWAAGSAITPGWVHWLLFELARRSRHRPRAGCIDCYSNFLCASPAIPTSRLRCPGSIRILFLSASGAIRRAGAAVLARRGFARYARNIHTPWSTSLDTVTVDEAAYSDTAAGGEAAAGMAGRLSATEYVQPAVGGCSCLTNSSMREVIGSMLAAAA